MEYLPQLGPNSATPYDPIDHFLFNVVPNRRRFCHRASLVTFRRFGGDTVWCPIETAAYDLEWPVGDLATQIFGSDGMSNG